MSVLDDPLKALQLRHVKDERALLPVPRDNLHMQTELVEHVLIGSKALRAVGIAEGVYQLDINIAQVG